MALLIGFVLAWLKRAIDMRTVRGRAESIVAEGAKAAEITARQTRLDLLGAQAEAETEAQRELEERAARLEEGTDELEGQERALEEWLGRVEVREAQLAALGRECADLEREVGQRLAGRATLEAKVRESLLTTSEVRTAEAASDLYLQPLAKSLSEEFAHWASRTIDSVGSDLEKSTARLIEIAICRCQVSHTGDHQPPVVSWDEPRLNDWLQGSGRSVEAYLEEQLGGELQFDPRTKTLTFATLDGVNREIARQVLEEIALTIRKREEPPELEHVENRLERITQSMNKKLVKIGKWAARQSQVGYLNPSLLPMLGRLKYRSSYGQNVLYHSIEVAYLTGLLATELGLDETTARRAGLLHDIGKAIDRERGEGHPELGAELLTEAEECQEVIEAAGGHHMDPSTQTIFPVLVGAADAISASRAGARRETGDRYIARLDHLEGMALEEKGVSAAYCVQGGREIRVFLDAEKVDDDEARAITDRILAKLNTIGEGTHFPGQVKLTVIREKRAVEIAK